MKGEKVKSEKIQCMGSFDRQWAKWTDPCRLSAVSTGQWIETLSAIIRRCPTWGAWDGKHNPMHANAICMTRNVLTISVGSCQCVLERRAFGNESPVYSCHWPWTRHVFAVFNKNNAWAVPSYFSHSARKHIGSMLRRDPKKTSPNKYLTLSLLRFRIYLGAIV